MTVKQLLTATPFTSLAEALTKMHPDKGTRRCLLDYKEAYDILCHTDFEGDGGEVTFDWQRSKDDDPDFWQGDGKTLLASGVEGDYWENIVGKTVKRSTPMPSLPYPTISQATSSMPFG